MPIAVKSFCAICALTVLTACGGGHNDVEEFVVVDPAPVAVTVEPVFSGKL